MRTVFAAPDPICCDSGSAANAKQLLFRVIAGALVVSKVTGAFQGGLGDQHSFLV
jgi:hypothetical protein